MTPPMSFSLRLLSPPAPAPLAPPAITSLASSRMNSRYVEWKIDEETVLGPAGLPFW